jgi:hypothetical protein
MQDMMTLVDENDNIVGPISKLNGHLLLQNNEKVLLLRYDTCEVGRASRPILKLAKLAPS